MARPVARTWPPGSGRSGRYWSPTRLTPQELGALLDEAFAATGATGPGDMGKVMGFVMSRARGKVDGTIVQAMVRERLSG